MDPIDAHTDPDLFDYRVVRKNLAGPEPHVYVERAYREGTKQFWASVGPLACSREELVRRCEALLDAARAAPFEDLT